LGAIQEAGVPPGRDDYWSENAVATITDLKEQVARLKE
jgi:hypothetical protein